MREPLEDVGVLDSTWGGTLADMVRVTHELEIVDRDNLIAYAAEMGAYLNERLRDLQRRHFGVMLNVRGMGLYQGFSLDSPARKGEVVRVARERYSTLLLGCGAQSIRFRPNLSVTREDVDQVIEILDAVLQEVS
jgi:L-lysine 6-transaminase